MCRGVGATKGVRLVCRGEAKERWLQRDEAATAAEASGATTADRVRAGLRQRWDELVSAAVRSRVDIAIVASITVLAAGLRVWHLGTVPLGLHGDAAWAGVDA